MIKHILRFLLGTGYVCLLTMMLLYQAGAFGGRREWTVVMLGTLILGVALAAVLWLCIRVSDRMAELETYADAGNRKRETGTGAKEKPAADEARQTVAQSYEEVYAQFLDVMKRCNLSERELEVAWLLYRGYTNRQIGEALYIAETTVKKHVSHIYQKMDVCSRKEFRAMVQTDSPG